MNNMMIELYKISLILKEFQYLIIPMILLLGGWSIFEELKEYKNS